MENTINFLLSGGGVLPPLTYYRPVMVNLYLPRMVNTSNSAYDWGTGKAKKEDSDTDNYMKEMSSLLKNVNALPSDLNLLKDNLKKFTYAEALGIDTSLLAGLYIETLVDLQNAAFNRKEYDKTFLNLSKTGGLDAPAMLEDGSLIVIDKDSKSPISINVDKYLQNKKKYDVLTNALLLLLRAMDPKYANNNNLLTITNSGIGMPDVKKYLNDLISKLGSSKIEKEYYTDRRSKAIYNGLELIEKAAESEQLNTDAKTVSGLFKNSDTTKELEILAKAALEFMYDSLPAKMKTLIKLTAGGKDPKVVITELLTSQMSPEVIHHETMILDATGKKPGSKGSSSGDGDEDAKLTVDKFSSMVNGTGGTDTNLRLMDKDGNSFSVNGKSYGNPSLKGGDLPEGSVQDLLDYGYGNFAKGGDYAITFGTLVLTPEDYDQIAFLNNMHTVRVLLPIKYEGSIVVPDLEFAQEHKELIDLINKKGGNTNDPEIRKEMLKIGLLNPVTGLPEMSKLQTYICIDGLATDRNLKKFDYVNKVAGDSLDKLIKKFETAVYKSKERNAGEEYKFDFDKDSWWPGDWGGLHDTLYQGQIFIPITENANQARQASGTSYKYPYHDEYELDYLLGEMRRNSNPTSSNLLFD